MKTLYLVRHAKSGWSDGSSSDRERLLTPRGEQDAALMGERWSQRDVRPALILSSPAVRARATAEILAGRLNCAGTGFRIDDRLYAASPAALIAVIGGVDDTLDRLMLVGHNPGLAELAHRFDAAIVDMPTCALAAFSFDLASWSGISRARPVRTVFDSPEQPSE